MEDPEARKNRLKALREKANKPAADVSARHECKFHEKMSEPRACGPLSDLRCFDSSCAQAPIKFRNYRPTDNTLLGTANEGSADKEAAAPPTAPPRKAEEEDAIKRELKKHIEEHGGGEDVLNIAPKKPNWDLKRDVSKKVEKLDRLTQRAIVDMLREKIANQEDESSSEEEEED